MHRFVGVRFCETFKESKVSWDLLIKIMVKVRILPEEDVFDYWKMHILLVTGSNPIDIFQGKKSVLESEGPGSIPNRGK